MPLRYLLDEHLRGALWDMQARHNVAAVYPLDIVRVGDVAELPIGVADPAILRWAEDENRILVSLDKSTLPDHLANHLASGRASPGIMVLRPRATLASIFEFLLVAAYASTAEEWANGLTYVP